MAPAGPEATVGGTQEGLQPASPRGERAVATAELIIPWAAGPMPACLSRCAEQMADIFSVPLLINLVRVCVCVHVYVYMYVCIYIYIYIYVCVCVCACASAGLHFNDPKTREPGKDD